MRDLNQVSTNITTALLHFCVDKYQYDFTYSCKLKL